MLFHYYEVSVMTKDSFGFILNHPVVKKLKNFAQHTLTCTSLILGLFCPSFKCLHINGVTFASNILV